MLGEVERIAGTSGSKLTLESQDEKTCNLINLINLIFKS